MYCWSSVPSGEIRWITIIRSGDFFLHGHADALHLFRQPRQRDRDAVLHQHLRLVDIGAGLEHDVDLRRAVAGRLRHHVDHVVDAVDLLLDRRGDGLGHDLGRGARIGGGHLDGRRRDLRKFSDRQRAKRDRADKRQDDRKHAGEDRPVDEEMRKSHSMPHHRRAEARGLFRGGLDLAVLGLDLLSGPRARQTFDHDAVVWRKARANDAQSIDDRAEFDFV